MAAGRTSKRRGFSLIELAIVVLILSLVAASLTFRWAGLLAPARLEHAVSSTVDFESQTRDLAIADQCPYKIRVGQNGKSLVAIRQSMPPVVRRIDFRGGVKIAWSEAVPNSGVDNARAGVVEITRAGTSPEYSLEVLSSAGSVRLDFSGATGQCTIVKLADK